MLQKRIEEIKIGYLYLQKQCKKKVNNPESSNTHLIHLNNDDCIISVEQYGKPGNKAVSLSNNI